MNTRTRLLLLLLAPAFSFAQSDAQQQQLTAVTQKFIAVYNTADTAQYHAFAAQMDTSAERIAGFMEQYRQEQSFVGRVAVKDIRVVSPTETHTLVQTPHYETWWRLIVVTDSQQRFKEHHLQLLRVTDDVLQPGMLAKAAIGDSINAFIKRQDAWEPFKGNVLIQKGTETIYSKSVGTTNEGKPHRMTDVMGLASVGKLFTAVSILQLVDAGKLSLDDAVGNRLPERHNKALANITIQQLLTHTSGMGDFFEDPQYPHILDSTKAALQAHHHAVTDAALHVSYFEQDALRFAPGTGWAYSNTGFELLGYLMEKVTGMPYTDYVRTHILKPVGMTATVPGSGAGGGTSTAIDLLRFTTALRNGKLLSKQRTEQFFTYQVNGQYGLGSEHQKLGGETIVGHSGGFEKICNEVNLYTKSGYTVIVLSNNNPPYGHFLGDKIKTLLVRKP